ncbi:UNVERIFIED_CONTAM: hypothetical protein PYX00_010242 [Menopon gallinae]|uniref:Uncharacterized protein n=1 Tax=Menopon gallinae TaxID=328185 RepID=A0AAW2HEI7_9NEOP
MFRGGSSPMKALGSGDELLLPTIKSEPGVHSPCEKDMVPSGSSQSNSLFSTIASSNKRPRTDDWLNPTSPGPPMGAAPLTPSPGPHNQYTVISNGYSSPMSSGSYDPYSPNGKLGKSLFPLPPSTRTNMLMRPQEIVKSKDVLRVRVERYRNLLVPPTLSKEIVDSLSIATRRSLPGKRHSRGSSRVG